MGSFCHCLMVCVRFGLCMSFFLQAWVYLHLDYVRTTPDDLAVASVTGDLAARHIQSIGATSLPVLFPRLDLTRLAQDGAVPVRSGAALPEIAAGLRRQVLLHAARLITALMAASLSRLSVPAPDAVTHAAAVLRHVLSEAHEQADVVAVAVARLLASLNVSDGSAPAAAVAPVLMAASLAPVVGRVLTSSTGDGKAVGDAVALLSRLAASTHALPAWVQPVVAAQRGRVREMRDATARVAVLTARSEALTTALHAGWADLRRATSEAAALRATHATELAQLRTSLRAEAAHKEAQVTAQAAALEATLRSQQGRLVAVESLLTTQLEDREQLDKMTRELRQRAVQAESAQTAADRQAVALNDALTQAQRQAATTTAELTALRASHATQAAALAAAQQSVASTQAAPRR